MRVCIDVSSLLKDLTGIGRYTAQLLQGLLRSEPESRYVLLMTALRGQPHPSLPRPSRRVQWVRRRLPGRALLASWERASWPSVERLAGRFDLFHSPNYLVQPVRRAPVVCTVHDLFFLRYPELTERRGGQLLARVLRRNLPRAAAVLCVSEATRRDVVEVFDLPRDRVHAIPNGLDPSFGPPTSEEVRRIRDEHHLPERYVLFLGTLEPRKNLPRLIRAFRRVRGDSGSDLGLVVAGGDGWAPEPLQAVAQGAEEGWLTRLGYVPDQDLPGLMGGAEALVLPSLHEGFGLPVLEAMACGCPVVCSRGGALPEVAGDAAFYCDALEEGSIRDALGTALSDGPLREGRRLRGLERAREFTWDRTARETMAVYHRVLEEHAAQGLRR